MTDSVGPSVALSKLVCKVTALENELHRLRSDATATAMEVKTTREEKDAIERTYKTSRSKWQEREREISVLVSHLQEQVTSALEERDGLLIEVDQKKRELETVLQNREAARIELKRRYHELEYRLKQSDASRVSMESEARCQKVLMTALENELSTIKTRQEEVEATSREQERQMTTYFETVQTALVETESLVRKLEEQQACVESLQGTLAAEWTNKVELEQENRLLKEASTVTERKVVELETELGDAYRRIHEEQEHKTRILEMLRSSEDNNTKVEETIQKQNIVISQLHQRVEALSKREDGSQEQIKKDDVDTMDYMSHQQDDGQVRRPIAEVQQKEMHP